VFLSLCSSCKLEYQKQIISQLMATKRINTSAGVAAQEVATLQKVLALQQKESIHLQEQINQLEGEVDESRKIAEKRQKHINYANDQLADRDSTIHSLEETLKAAKVEGKAFEKFSSQNKMLLESYLAEQKQSERAKEVQYHITLH
jgi:TolA-binding protein